MKYFLLLSLILSGFAMRGSGVRGPIQQERMLTVEEVMKNPEIMSNLKSAGLTIEEYKALPEEEQRELQECTPAPVPTVSPAPSMAPSVSLEPSVSNSPSSPPDCDGSPGSSDSGDGDDSEDGDDSGDDRRESISKFFIGVMHRLYGH